MSNPPKNILCHIWFNLVTSKNSLVRLQQSGQTKLYSFSFLALLKLFAAKFFNKNNFSLIVSGGVGPIWLPYELSVKFYTYQNYNQDNKSKKILFLSMSTFSNKKMTFFLPTQTIRQFNSEINSKYSKIHLRKCDLT